MAGEPEITGASLVLATVILNALRDADKKPSVTEITIPELMPTSSFVGTPESTPFTELKLAQVGLFTILKVNVSPTSASLKVGEKL